MTDLRATTMWRSDGWGWRARIGLLVPHADICEEAEIQAMSPDGVSIHSTRVPSSGTGVAIGIAGADPLRAYLEPPLLDNAAELMAFAPVHVIAMCYTNTSFLGTVDDDRTLVARLQRRPALSLSSGPAYLRWPRSKRWAPAAWPSSTPRGSAPT